MEKAQEIEMLKEFSDANATSGFEEEFVKLLLAMQKRQLILRLTGCSMFMHQRRKTRATVL